MKSKHLLATIAATVAAVTALACGGGSGDTESSVGGSKKSPAVEKSTTTAKLGETVTLTNNAAGNKTAIEVTVANAKQFTKEPGELGLKPEHGVFVALDVTVVSKSGSYDVNPLNFKFVAKDGTVSEYAPADGFKPELQATTVAAGQKTAGKLVFDVSKAALTGGRIQIEGVGLDFDKPAAYWAL